MNGIVEIELPEIEGLQEAFAENITSCQAMAEDGH